MIKLIEETLLEYRKTDECPDESQEFSEYCTDVLQMGVLGFCGCGNPETSLLYIMQGLELITAVSPEDPVAWEIWRKAHREVLTSFFGTVGAEYFFFYWCDKEGLTEHGSGMPGWLTADGKKLLNLLQEWKEANKYQICT